MALGECWASLQRKGFQRKQKEQVCTIESKSEEHKMLEKAEDHSDGFYSDLNTVEDQI